MPKKDKHPIQSPSGRVDCYFCQARHGLEKHHIVPDRMGGSDKDYNRVKLCKVCHHKIETLYNARFYEELGIPDEKGERKTHLPCCWGDCKSSVAYVVVGKQYGERWHYCEECIKDVKTEGDNLEVQAVNGHEEFQPDKEEETATRSHPVEDVW